jgi:hypothetical protein
MRGEMGSQHTGRFGGWVRGSTLKGRHGGRGRRGENNVMQWQGLRGERVEGNSHGAAQ